MVRAAGLLKCVENQLIVSPTKQTHAQQATSAFLSAQGYPNQPNECASPADSYDQSLGDDSDDFGTTTNGIDASFVLPSYCFLRQIWMTKGEENEEGDVFSTSYSQVWQVRCKNRQAAAMNGEAV